MGLGANWHVVEGLYGIDYHDYSTFNELATDAPKSVDDTTFEVTIRKGAKFSEGTEVDVYKRQFRWRGAAYSTGNADRRGSHGRALYSGRALDRSSSA